MAQGRGELLKSIIRDLHAGVDVEVLRERFRQLVGDVGAAEIAEMEQQLIAEGTSEEEVKRLCDLHTQVFRDALDRQEPGEAPPGHPLDALRRENVALGEVSRSLSELLAGLGEEPVGKLAAERTRLRESLDRLAEVEKHHRRKENELFPVLERRGIVAPPKVMWATHDDIRALLKKTGAELDALRAEDFVADARALLRAVEDMIHRRRLGCAQPRRGRVRLHARPRGRSPAAGQREPGSVPSRVDVW